MKLEITNDELFVLCALGKCTEIIGVANPFVAMNEEDVFALAENILGNLEAKEYITKTQEGTILSDLSKKIIELISGASETYIVSDEKNEDYIFVKTTSSMHMKNVNFENCIIDVYDDINGVKEFFKNEFTFFKAHTDLIQYMISIPSETMDKAIGKAEEGKFDEAIKILDGDDFEKDEIMNMLNSIIFPDLSKIIICRKTEKTRSSESIYKICGTDNGAWIVKISTNDEGANTLVYKATDDDITKIIFEV